MEGGTGRLKTHRQRTHDARKHSNAARIPNGDTEIKLIHGAETHNPDKTVSDLI